MKLTHGQEVARSRILGSPYVIITGDRQTGKSTLVLETVDMLKRDQSYSHIMVITHNLHSSVEHEPLLRVLRSTTHHFVGARVPHSNEYLEYLAQHPDVTKFSMISSPGPGQFFSEILETCSNHGPWLRPVYVHHELECTESDREYFKNTQFCSDPELLELFNQQQDINQRIQNILSKGNK